MQKHSLPRAALLAALFFSLHSAEAVAGRSETDWEAANTTISEALERGDLPAALHAGEEAARIAQESFGPKHMKTAVALKKLADLQRLSGDVKSSAATFSRASQLWAVNLGANHPYATEVLIESARDRSTAEDWAGASADLQTVIKTQKAYYGKRHTAVATTLQELGRVQRRAGQWQAAYESELEAANILLDALEPGNPRTLAAFQELSAHEAGRGNTDTARKDLKRALDSAVRGGESVSPLPLSSAYSLSGDLAFQDGDLAVAEESYQRALKLLEPLDAAVNVHRLSILYKLRELYQSAGRDEAASQTAEQARRIESQA